MFEKLKHCSSIGFQWIIGVHDSDAWAIEDQVLQRKTQKNLACLRKMYLLRNHRVHQLFF